MWEEDRRWRDMLPTSALSEHASKFFAISSNLVHYRSERLDRFHLHRSAAYPVGEREVKRKEGREQREVEEEMEKITTDNMPRLAPEGRKLKDLVSKDQRVAVSSRTGTGLSNVCVQGCSSAFRLE